MKYRKKPVVIEAVQIAKGMEKPDWLAAAIDAGTTWERQYEDGTTLIVVKTPEGEMTATDGDWIIRDIKGELYPCKDDIFKATYDVELESKYQAIDWTEISNRGLLRRINSEIMHPLGLAVFRDPNTGLSGGALVAPDGKWEYEGSQTQVHETLQGGRATLAWYAEQVAGCRKFGPAGEAARSALDKDGGERARAALASGPVAGEVVAWMRKDGGDCWTAANKRAVSAGGIPEKLLADQYSIPLAYAAPQASAEDARNAALEEAAKLMDQTSRSSGAELIRSLKTGFEGSSTTEAE